MFCTVALTATLSFVDSSGTNHNHFMCLRAFVRNQKRRKTVMNENEIGSVIVDCAVKLHKTLSPGLLESVYEAVLAKQLARAGLTVRRQFPVPIIFEDLSFDEGFRADLIVNQSVIIEIKSVEKIHPVHKKQLLTYLKLTGLKLGYLLNFGDELMKSGLTRIINGTL
jgi:GxxExxY protein